MSFTPHAIAHKLENEISDHLAAVLLWMQYAGRQNKTVTEDPLSEAEQNLRSAISHIRALHQSIRTNTTPQ